MQLLQLYCKYAIKDMPLPLPSPSAVKGIQGRKVRRGAFQICIHTMINKENETSKFCLNLMVRIFKTTSFISAGYSSIRVSILSRLFSLEVK